MSRQKLALQLHDFVLQLARGRLIQFVVCIEGSQFALALDQSRSGLGSDLFFLHLPIFPPLDPLPYAE